MNYNWAKKKPSSTETPSLATVLSFSFLPPLVKLLAFVFYKRSNPTSFYLLVLSSASFIWHLSLPSLGHARRQKTPICYFCKYLLLPEMTPSAFQWHTVRNWPGCTLTGHFSAQTQSCLTICLSVMPRGRLLQLKYSAHVFLNYEFSSPDAKKAFTEVASESRANSNYCL